MKKNDSTQAGGKVQNTQSREYATHGAKLHCPYCTIPIGDLIVTSNNIEIQGKRSATTADRIPMTNIVFKGQCIVGPGLIPPPCAAVMRLGEWMNFSPNVQMFGHNALLTESTILCMSGGSQIRIVDSGQVVKMIKIEPMPKEIFQACWMDGENERQIREIMTGDYSSLIVKTFGFEEGEEVEVVIRDIDNLDLKENTKEIVLKGKVNADKTVEFKEHIIFEAIDNTDRENDKEKP